MLLKNIHTEGSSSGPSLSPSGGSAAPLVAPFGSERNFAVLEHFAGVYFWFSLGGGIIARH